ncbi:MAG TPA: lysylphosphatidylglycerol synthase transmembrane domain-containing protein [Gemmatimonadaceae bacterium]|nr:lysylphosphatidylglycerol synthase transmembrane domain-containing protein [Gemmatimonadaceae bacterium]
MILRSSARRVAHALMVALLAVLFAIALVHLDLARAAVALATARPEWLALAVSCYLAILLLWAWQWHLLAPRRPGGSMREMLRVVAATSSVLNTVPMLAGEAAGIAFLVTLAGLSRAAAVSVLAMDQLLVGIAKLGVLASAAVWAPLPVWMTRGVLALVGGVSLLGALLLLVAWGPRGVARRVAPLLPAPVVRALGALRPALAPLRSPPRGGGALALALLKKLVEMLAIVCVQRAFGLALPFGSAVLTLAALNLATLLPIVPGNVGVYEAAVVFAYTSLGVPPERALAVALVQHLCAFLAFAGPGVLATATSRWGSEAARRRDEGTR